MLICETAQQLKASNRDPSHPFHVFRVFSFLDGGERECATFFFLPSLARTATVRLLS